MSIASVVHAQDLRAGLGVSVLVQPSVVVRATATAVVLRTAAGETRLALDDAGDGATRVTSEGSDDGALRVTVDF